MDSMGIDYSDVISGLYIFLLVGLCFTLAMIVLAQQARIKYLENKTNKLLLLKLNSLK